MRKLVLLSFAGYLFLTATTLKAQSITDLNAPVSVAQKRGVEMVCDYLDKCKYYFLATDEDGQPRVRPFGTALVFENRLFIQTGKKKAVSKQINKNPRIEICAYNAEQGTWMRITAEAVNDDNIVIKEAMLNKYPDLRKMYNEKDENTQVLYLKNAKAVIYSFNEEPVNIRF
jgi:uncharacterized pyridoxamine 5'-phosphate oxidase family protein